MVQNIALSGAKGAGRYALVDDEDVPLVAGYTWVLAGTQPGGSTQDYAIAYVPGSGHRGRTIFMHVLLMGRVGIDHMNGDGLDNRREHLRVATRAQQMANSRPIGGSSMFKGVCLTRWGWQAYITVDRKRHHLGYYADETEAAIVYDVAARAAFDSFARLNFAHCR